MVSPARCHYTNRLFASFLLLVPASVLKIFFVIISFRGGACFKYQGNVCRESLKTLPVYRETKRFFDNKFGLPGTEKFLATIINIINDFASEDKKCRYIMVNMLCHYTVPPCYPDGMIIDYCKGDCEEIFKECSITINQVIGAVKLHLSNEKIDFIHRGLPDCSRHHSLSYYERLPGNKTCIKSGFFSKYCCHNNEIMVTFFKLALKNLRMHRSSGMGARVSNASHFCQLRAVRATSRMGRSSVESSLAISRAACENSPAGFT